MHQVEIRYGAATDVGRVREVNEDAHLAMPPVFVVADGMGGHEGGDVASAIVVEEFGRLAATGYDPAVATFWRGHIELIVAAGAERLRRAQQQGFVAPDADIEPLASMVAWTIERTISMYALDHPEADDPALARSMARGLWLMMYGFGIWRCFSQRQHKGFTVASAMLVYGIGAGLTEGSSFLSRPNESWFLIWIPLALVAALSISQRALDKR